MHMADEQSPLTDRDAMLRIIQKTVAVIMADVASITDITNNKQKSTLMNNITQLLDALQMTVGQVFPEEIAEAYLQGHSLGGDLLEGIDGEVKGNLKNKLHAEAVQEIAAKGMSDLEAAIRTAGVAAIACIEGTLEKVQQDIAEGVIKGASTKVITEAVKKSFLEAGMTSFLTSDDRALPLDFYAMTVTRTKVRDAHAQGAANRYKENDIDLVRFNQRSYTCKVCGSRQGMVVSLTGKTEGYPTVDDIGGLPPFHPNCKHYPIPVTDPSAYPPKPFNDVDKRSAESKKHYTNEQKIRRKANREKKQYMKMKAEADSRGEDFPNIGTWRRMKRKNDDNWKTLQANYKQSIAAIDRKTPAVGSPAPVMSNGAKYVESIRQLQANLDAVRTPPQAATISPFNRENFDYEFKGSLLVLEGKGAGTPSPTEKPIILELLNAEGHKEMLNLLYKLEDDGNTTEYINRIGERLETLYKQREKLFDVKDHNIAFGRHTANKLGEKINAIDVRQDINDREKMAIQNYTGSQSTVINQYFREGKSGNGGVDDTSKYLDAVISRNQLTEDVMLYRGADYKAIGGAMAKDILNGNIDKYIGATIQDKGYVSTSLGATTRFQNKVGFQIKAPKGTNGVYVESITSTAGEQEVILPRGTTFRIVEIKKQGSDIELLVEVVQ